MRHLLLALVFHLAVLSPAFLASSPAAAQECEAQLRMSAIRRAKASVSASALQIPPKAWGHFEKARVAGEMGDLDTLNREVGLSLAAAPAFTQVYVLQAAAQVRAKHFDEAIATIAKARGIASDVPWSGVVLASALTGLHRYDESVAASERVHGTEAESWQWRVERSRAEIGRRNVAGALHYSELALAVSPSGCTETHLIRSNALQLAGRRRDAVVELEAYLEASPQGAVRADVLRVLEHTRAQIREEDDSLLAAR